MNTKYNTKEEAIAEVLRLRAEPPEIFCPLSALMCRKDCPCYQDPHFVTQTSYEKGKGDVFWAYPACCNNTMFFNTCQGGC